jgi:beta-lactamase regulating signal transducer with metallopeptidase domain
METISDAMSRSLLTFLLNSLWQIPLAAAVAALACRFMRTGPASHRHAIWVAALAAAILLPLASVRTVGPTAAPPFAVSLPAPDAIPAKSGLAHGLAHGSGRGLVHGLVHELGLPTQLPPALSPAPASATVSFAKTWAAILLGAYALFVLVRLARLVRAAMRTVRIRRAAHEAAIPELLERVSSRCQAAFGLTGVKLLFSAQVSGPVTAGRAIILPESLRVEAPEDVVTTAIGHEMAHIARRDFASNLLYELLQLPVGFHPAAWLIRSGMERTREMACDEAVALRLIDAAVYARSIMSIAAGMTALPHPGYTLGVFDGDILEERIRRLVERPAPNLKHARLMLVAGLSALALCAVIASSLALTAAAQGVAGNLMKQAGDAYNRGDYEEAARQFEDAVRRDPANLKAKLFLADSLLCELQEYGPAADTRVIVAKAQQQYLDVMARDATNKHAMQGMMALYTRTMHFAQAHEWALKAIQADPANATAYYTAGFVDWVIGRASCRERVFVGV